MNGSDLDRLCAALPDVEALAQKVSRVHGPADPRLREVDRTLGAAAAALRDLAQGRPSLPKRDIAAGLARLRGLTDGFRPPAQACRSYRALLNGLEELEAAALPLLG